MINIIATILCILFNLVMFSVNNEILSQNQNSLGYISLALLWIIQIIFSSLILYFFLKKCKVKDYMESVNRISKNIMLALLLGFIVYIISPIEDYGAGGYLYLIMFPITFILCLLQKMIINKIVKIDLIRKNILKIITISLIILQIIIAVMNITARH